MIADFYISGHHFEVVCVDASDEGFLVEIYYEGEMIALENFSSQWEIQLYLEDKVNDMHSDLFGMHY